MYVAIFDTKKQMNEKLDEFSNSIEGVIVNRDGHNFALESLTDTLRRKLSKLFDLGSCTYFIAYTRGDTKTFLHEKRHYMFYSDPKYRKRCEKLGILFLPLKEIVLVTGFLPLVMPLLFLLMSFKLTRRLRIPHSLEYLNVVSLRKSWLGFSRKFRCNFSSKTKIIRE